MCIYIRLLEAASVTLLKAFRKQTPVIRILLMAQKFAFLVCLFLIKKTLEIRKYIVKKFLTKFPFIC